LIIEQIRTTFSPSDQTMWASVFVRESYHGQDVCRLRQQLAVAHFHEARHWAGYLFCLRLTQLPQQEMGDGFVFRSFEEDANKKAPHDGEAGEGLPVTFIRRQGSDRFLR